MPRIKLTIPDKKIFTATIPVRITDINYGNHLGNDALVSILHEARMQWLASARYTELNTAGAALIMSDLAVEYKNQSTYGDHLVIHIAIAEIQRKSFEMYYEVIAERAERQLPVANAKTAMVCYDYAVSKPVMIPEELHAFLSGDDKDLRVK